MLTLGDNLRADIVFHRYRLAILEDNCQLADEQVAQLFALCLELCVHLREGLAVSQFLLAVFVRTRVQLTVNHHAIQRRSSLQGSVLHIACLVAEDGFQQFLLRRGVALTLRGNLTHEDIARVDMRTHANDTILIEVFRCILADVRDVGSELLHTALGLAHLEQLLYHVHRGVHIFAHDTLAQNNSVLVVVTFPRNIRHFQVLTQR